MAAYLLWTVFTWTFEGILCTCRFLWICPYNAVKSLPRGQHIAEDAGMQLKQLVGSECKGAVAIPGSPERTAELHKRLAKVEREILTVKTSIACERASWERRFGELQKGQEELQHQAGVLVNMGDNGEALEDRSSDLSRTSYLRGGPEASFRDGNYGSSLPGCPSCSSSTLCSRPASPSSSATSLTSWRTTKGPRRVFVPHSPLDLTLGHRVRIMLPSGRISTGTIRFLGHLRGEAELHLGVELQTPDHELHDGCHQGYSYFQCEPGHGAFVPFHKLLMVWE